MRLALLLLLTGSTWAYESKQCELLFYGECFPTVDEDLIDKLPQDRELQDLIDFLSPTGTQNQRRIDSALARPNLLSSSEAEALLWQGIALARAKLIDKQSGGTPNSSGTTSTVSRGAVSSLLSLAVENGALARTARGTATTFRGNLLGLLNLAAGAAQLPYCPIQQHCGGGRALLDSLSFNATFNPQQAASPLITSTPTQIRDWGARWDWRTRNKILSPGWKQDPSFARMVEFAESYAPALAKSAENLPPAERQRILQKYLPLFTAPDAVGFRFNQLTQAILAEFVDAKQQISGSTEDARNEFTTQGAYLGARDQILMKYTEGWNTAIELNSLHPLEQPAYWNARAVLALTFSKNRPLTWTTNAAASWYQHKQGAGIRKLRDLQIATEISKKVQRPNDVSMTIAAGYYLQWMAQEALLNIDTSANTLPGTAIPASAIALRLLGTKGAIHVGQLRFTFSHPDWPVSIPVSIHLSNRSEFIPDAKLRPSANIGISLDFDQLMKLGH